MAENNGNPLREVLYEYLQANSSINRWHQPFFDLQDAADLFGVSDIGALEKPYGVIVMREETGSPQTRVGWFQPVEIWPYFPPGNYLPVDAAVDEIIGLLSGHELAYDGRYYRVEYQGTGPDYNDNDLRAITRRIDFTVPKVRRI